MWDYTKKVQQHFLHPSNVGEIENPDGFGEVGNFRCGDVMRLTFKLDDNGRIADIKFKTYGCASAIASASILTEMCEGKTIDEVAEITNKDIADALGGLPPEKMHCSVLGQEALKKAIEFYKSRGKSEEKSLKEGDTVCECFDVTDLEIENAIRENDLKTVKDVTDYTKAGGGCGKCIPKIEEILEKVHGKTEKETPVSAEMSNIEKIDRIRNVLDTDIRPPLQKDGGDCELVDIDGNTVFIRFKGMCAGCEFASITQFDFIEKMLKEKVSKDIVVRQAR